MPGRNTITTVGAVIAVLLAIPGFFIGLHGFYGLISLDKIVAGGLGAAWGYGCVMGTYELIRRKNDMDRWRQYADLNLLAGTMAVSLGMIVSGAIRETMPGLALLPALSAIIQANDGYETKHRAWIHAGIIVFGIALGYYIYRNPWFATWLALTMDSLP